ncbi:MAG: hypothetical protein QM768_16195 [Agriterribacter sp.]
MKKILFVAFATTALFISRANAQKDDKPFSFGFGIEAGPLVGDKDFKHTFGGEFGLSLRFAVKAGPGYVTFTPGGMLVFPKSVNEDDEEIKIGTHVPLKLGYKYIIGKFFVMGEAGYSRYVLYTVNQESENIDDIEKIKGGGFTYAPSVGLNLGKFELGVRYESTLAKFNGYASKPSLLGIRAGFNF